MFNLGVFKMRVFDFKMALKRSFFVRLSPSFSCDLTLTLSTCRLSFVEIGDKKFQNVPRVPPLVRKIFFCSDPNETWSAGRDIQGKVTAGRGGQSGLKPGRNRYFSFRVPRRALFLGLLLKISKCLGLRRYFFFLVSRRKAPPRKKKIAQYALINF